MSKIVPVAQGCRTLRCLAALVAGLALSCGGRENAKSATPPPATSRHAAPAPRSALPDYEVDAPGLEILFGRPDAEGRPGGSGAACDRLQGARAPGEGEGGSSCCNGDSPAHCK